MAPRNAESERPETLHVEIPLFPDSVSHKHLRGRAIPLIGTTVKNLTTRKCGNLYGIGITGNRTENPANGISHAEVDTLIDALDSDNERSRLNAAYRLGRVGADAVPTLKQALHGTSDAIRNYAGYSLSLTGAPAIPTLIDALQATDDSVRATAAYALADMGKTAQEAIPALTRAAQDPSEWVRRHAAEGLGLIGTASFRRDRFVRDCAGINKRIARRLLLGSR